MNVDEAMRVADRYGKHLAIIHGEGTDENFSLSPYRKDGRWDDDRIRMDQAMLANWSVHLKAEVERLREREKTLCGHLDWIGWSDDGIAPARKELEEAKAEVERLREACQTFLTYGLPPTDVSGHRAWVKAREAFKASINS